MKIFGSSVRRGNGRIRRVLPLFLVGVLGLVFINSIKQETSAADISNDFTITEAHMHGDGGVILLLLIVAIPILALGGVIFVLRRRRML